MKFFLLTTVPVSMNFFKNQIGALNKIFDITIISSPGEILYNSAEREKVNYQAIDMKRDISLFNDLKSLFFLILYFLKEKPTVVHCNTPKASLLGLLAGYFCRVPYRIYYIHGLRYEGTVGNKRKLLIFLERIICFCATHIIAVSNGTKSTALRDLTSKNIEIIHNGSANGMVVEEFLTADYDPSKIRQELGIKNEDFVLGFVGRIVGDKGINELIYCFDQFSKTYIGVKLILVGSYEEELDPIEESTKQLIKSNPNILEVGFQKDVKKFLSIFDVFVSPSYREGFGLSLLEANLMGVPVIATDITGYNEIILEGKNGFLITPKNKNDLYQKIIEVYTNRDKLFVMKKFCVEHVVQKFNHHDVLAKALKYYSSIIK